MLTKDKLKKTIDSLPDDFTLEDIIEELVILDKIEQGLKDVKGGNVHTTDQVRQKLEKWLK